MRRFSCGRPFASVSWFALAALLATALLATRRAEAQPPIPIPSSCPTQDATTWVYTMDDAERALANVDLEGKGTTFSFLADFQGTSIIIRVRDAHTGESIGVIKTNTSNTSPSGEVYAYRLARLLGFPELVAPVIPVHLGDGALSKIRDLLKNKRYRDANKEASRVYLLRKIETAIRHHTPFHGAFKKWVSSFIFVTSLGKRERIGQRKIARYFRATDPQPEHGDVRLSQLTRLYSPQGTYRGTADLAQLAEDYSNMMLMDALMGQNDRFAGANVHIRSLAGQRKKVGARRGMPIFDLGRVRLLALDNGASMRAKGGAGLLDLEGKRNPDTRMERFSPTAVAQLRLLAKTVLGTGCAHPASARELQSIFDFLGVHDARTRTRAIEYIQPVLTYIDRLQSRYGDKIFFAPIAPDPEPPVKN